MRHLFRTCLIANCLSVVSTAFLLTTGLALTTRGYCVPILMVPFTDKTFVLPMWMWGRGPFCVWAISTLTAVVFWIMLVAKRKRIRQVQELT